MEDQQIVALYWDRDPRAIQVTSQRFGGYCYAIADRILADPRDAEECVNDTWLGAWNAMPEHRPQRLAPFLGKITRRLAINRWKALRAQKRGGGELPLLLEELEDCLPSAASPEQAVEDDELARSLNDFLHSLPARSCDIFLRRYWYAESVSDIARRYGMGEGAVKSSLFRSREKLRQHLLKEEIWI